MEFVCCSLPLQVGVQNRTLQTTTCAKYLVELPEIIWEKKKRKYFEKEKEKGYEK